MRNVRKQTIRSKDKYIPIPETAYSQMHGQKRVDRAIL